MVEHDAAGAEPADFTQSTEFQDAVAKAVAAVVPGAVAAALANMPQASPAVGDASYLMESLAMSIAKLTDQGVGQKPVDPALLRARDESRNLMFDLIAKARAEGRTASYKLKGKFFVDEVIEPNFIRASDHTYQATEIDYSGVPNESMEPINDTAREIFDAFMGSIRGTLHPVPYKEGFMITGKAIVKNDPSRSFNGEVTDEVRAAQSDLNDLRIRREDPAGYVVQQILGTTSAGRAMVTK